MFLFFGDACCSIGVKCHNVCNLLLNDTAKKKKKKPTQETSVYIIEIWQRIRLFMHSFQIFVTKELGDKIIRWVWRFQFWDSECLLNPKQFEAAYFYKCLIIKQTLKPVWLGTGDTVLNHDSSSMVPGS